MNPKVLMFVEILLMAIFIVLVLFVFDTSKTIGLIETGVALVVIFALVLLLEKRRERAVQAAEVSVESISSPTATTINPPSSPPPSRPPLQ